MSFREKKERSPDSPLKKRRASWSDTWRKNTTPLKHVVLAMHLQSLASPKSKAKTKARAPNFSESDRTLLLSDDILLRILAKLPDSQRNANSLVCKRWLNLQGRLVRSLKVLDREFLESGRLISRFPNLDRVDLVSGCLVSPKNSGILVNHGVVSFHLDSGFSPSRNIIEENVLPAEMVDRVLRTLASGCPNLRKLGVINASELGLLNVAEECATLQELELHKCNDNVLRGIAAFENLQILRLIGNLDWLYSSSVSDIGLTILAQGCKRLVKLELSGCKGSFDGIKAIGHSCQMLEELTICDHRMEPGWLTGLSFCENLKTLKIVSCKRIDSISGLEEERLGSCSALERLHLCKCQLRNKKSVEALFRICESVREVVFQDCWGFDNDAFSLARIFRRVWYLSLEGCSLISTEVLESVILPWQDLESLRVVSCKNIKDSEISPALSSLFSLLKELSWRPDTKSHLMSSLAGTGMGKRGRKFFKRS